MGLRHVVADDGGRVIWIAGVAVLRSVTAAMSVPKMWGPGARAMARFDAAIAEVEDAVRRRVG
ncbi:MAG: hypothetical protein JWN20_53 [Jatrophihabitantaceae bacterium]|nr:hypothetical protein [Jatrophihabitantaceae bacterium]